MEKLPPLLTVPVVKLWRGGCAIDVPPHTNEGGVKYMGSRGGNTRKVVEIAHTQLDRQPGVYSIWQWGECSSGGDDLDNRVIRKVKRRPRCCTSVCVLTVTLDCMITRHAIQTLQNVSINIIILHRFSCSF